MQAKKNGSRWPATGDITNDKELVAGSCKGILIAGRSKGAAEAVIIATKLWSPLYHNRIIVGAIDPPMMCDKEFARYVERLLGKENISWTCYKNDIVPGIPSWFTFPGKKHQIGTGSKPCRHHQRPGECVKSRAV